jgi:hypothetical protein
MPRDPMAGFEQFLWAIGQQESSGNYTDVNRSSGALGKYQVMPGNVASWSKRVLGHSVSTTEFLHSPQLQEQIVKGILGEDYRRYGPAGAAAMWYSGQPDPTKTYGHPSVKAYVAQVLGRMKKAPGGDANTPAPTPNPTGTPGGGGGTGGLFGQLIGLPKELTGLLQAMEKPMHALLWLVNPTSWARIIAGIAGFLLLGAGLFTLAKAA